jgi:hypothetical protein
MGTLCVLDILQVAYGKIYYRNDKHRNEIDFIINCIYLVP